MGANDRKRAVAAVGERLQWSEAASGDDLLSSPMQRFA